MQPMVLVWILIGIWALGAVSLWKIFEKAGEKGWISLIPFYRTKALIKICYLQSQFPRIMAIDVVLAFGAIMYFAAAQNNPTAIGGIMVVVAVCVVWLIVIGIKLNQALAQSFGHEKNYGWLLFLLGFVFQLVIGFGKDQYQGNLMPNQGIDTRKKKNQ